MPCVAQKYLAAPTMIGGGRLSVSYIRDMAGGGRGAGAWKANVQTGFYNILQAA